MSKKESTFLQNNKVRCVVPNTLAPFQNDNNKESVGINFDYWKIISKHAKIPHKCENVGSFFNVLNRIKNKKADFTIATTITKENSKYANFSKSYLSYPISITTRNSENFVTNTSFLNYKKVAIGRWHSAYEVLKVTYPKINFIQADNVNKALKMVSKNEAFVAINILPVLSHEIAKNEYSNLKINGTTEFNFKIRVIVREDYPQLMSIINKGIDLITEDERNKIENKWVS